MNALVKKEIRLLLPSWIVALLLSLIQAITRPYDFYVACLLFFGLTIMALTTIGRETSLNTFSFMLAQPAERMRIWQTKLSVLVVAFLTVFFLWLTCFFISGVHGFATNDYDSYNLFITVCLIATATFTGGLWTTLLLRQLAAAFWLTLLVPAILAGYSGAFLALVPSQSNSAVITALCLILGIYSVGGFLFARWLFFRAQDVGWSGGIIALPEWQWSSAHSETGSLIRKRKPIFALLKKEFQLQQASLMGAGGLLALHIGIIALRKYHHFAKDSAGEAITFIITCIFWILWLILPIIIGNVAVAEERRLGVMEGQLCLPASRRIQFVIKCFVTLFLGIFLGGVMPMLLEAIGVAIGAQNPAFTSDNHTDAFGFFLFLLGTVAFSAWLALVSFFASSLAKNFLQAVGYAIVTFICLTMMIPALADERIGFYGSMPIHSILPLVIAVPTIIVTLPWLAYLNYRNFRDGWALWRRNLLGVAGAIIFITVSSTAIYNRAWEVFEPAEPSHGPAKLSLANPPTLQLAQYRNLLVRLPEGRVWFDYLDGPFEGYYGYHYNWNSLYRMLLHPLPKSVGPQRFVAGSNWVAATTEHLNFGWHDSASGKQMYSSGYFDTVGIQPDGTLWVSGKSETNEWTANTLQRFGSEINWRQLAQSRTSVVLLKNDGTLWRWGSVSNEWRDWAHQWPGLRAFKPYQIGTNSDWQELFTLGAICARQADGRVWHLNVDWKTGKDELGRATNLDAVVSQTASRAGDRQTAFVRADGTLWVLNRYWDDKNRQMVGTGVLQVGKENDWRSVAVDYHMMVALKADGSLWQWHFRNESIIGSANIPPTRLGIHQDWVALANSWGEVFALAADGSLWLWPDREFFEYGILLRLPKQPQFLGNVFGQPN